MVLVRFPFTDLSGDKRRPVLILAVARGDDVVAAFVTSRGGAQTDPTEIVLVSGDPEFATTGLRVASAIRLSRLATLHRGLITARLGRVGPRTAAAVGAGLRHLFQL